ncbi:diguanylate cyclase (GGDEF) domain-containing protein [Paenibacillus barengoltzii]|uniref:sensor domain-containing diguanylate cyclase n=1 Tax=Paenibacillus barengoltzii TaxID=343517 RepID=UPI000A090429|nr:GGDEF domain-containing protein [Paenibacillus barengoltzii]SMF59559.1 diguanylate cyclase (GGDEF) domain-containing protein [Paenibacillus barengoltzii]
MCDVLTLLVPSIFLWILATYILVRSYPYKTARFLAAGILCSAVGFTAELIALMVSTDWSRSIHLYVGVIALYLSFAFIVHILYDMIQTMQPSHMAGLPRIFYGFSILMLGMGYVGSTIMTQPLLSTLANIGSCTVVLALLCMGYKYVMSAGHQLFFKVCFGFAAIVCFGIVLSGIHVVSFPFVVPATPGLWLSAMACTLIACFIVKLNLVPSAAKRYSSLMESSATPMVILDKHKQVLEVNDIGKLNYQMRIHTDFRNYFNYQNDPDAWDQMFAHLDENFTIKGYRIHYLNEDGNENIVLVDASKVNLGCETYYYCMIHEVTQEFQLRTLNEYLAYHDVLTGVYNRAYFEGEVKRKLAQDRKPDGAMIICDLNFFKEINDTYGHQIGDQVLIFTARFWREHLPKPHLFARLGGDEFVMFFEEINSEDLFLKQVNKVRNAFQYNLYRQDQIQIEIVPSIGVAFVGEDGMNYEQLYHTCDTRMYDDKKTVKEQYCMKQVCFNRHHI